MLPAGIQWLSLPHSIVASDYCLNLPNLSLCPIRAKAYDKEFVLIYGPDGTFKLERVTQYFTYLKEARSMVHCAPRSYSSSSMYCDGRPAEVAPHVDNDRHT